MQKASVWAEKVMIPTYEIGEAEKNPIFLEKRVYQGSCGKVYPYPTIEKISDEKKDKEYIAEKGLETIRKHAEDFVAKRLAPAVDVSSNGIIYLPEDS